MVEGQLTRYDSGKLPSEHVDAPDHFSEHFITS